MSDENQKTEATNRELDRVPLNSIVRGYPYPNLSTEERYSKSGDPDCPRCGTNYRQGCPVCGGRGCPYLILIKAMNKRWWIEFEGKCVACIHARATPRKQEMECTYKKAALHGLKDRPGGTWMGESVHKLFGCVYFKSVNQQEKVDAIAAILDHSYEGAENGCRYCGEVNEIASRLSSNSEARHEA
jgi:hypothetical protein